MKILRLIIDFFKSFFKKRDLGKVQQTKDTMTNKIPRPNLKVLCSGGGKGYYKKAPCIDRTYRTINRNVQ